MTDTELSMREISSEDEKYEEEWKVILSSGGEYTLSKLQARIVMQAMSEGKREVMFKTFMISIPYIAEFYRVRKFLKNTKQLPARASELPYKPISKEKFEEFKKKAYKAIGKKYVAN